MHDVLVNLIIMFDVPSVTGAKKAMSDIKEELRREGLLTLPTDSFSASDNSMDFPTPTSVDQGGVAPLGPSRLSTNSRLQVG